jgi:hypothetical protein
VYSCSTIHKGYFVVKNWYQMFVLKLSGIQILFNHLMGKKCESVGELRMSKEITIYYPDH